MAYLTTEKKEKMVLFDDFAGAPDQNLEVC
jgi:hypothetical protein